MIQLQILSGKKAGAVWVARRFPVRIGRDAKADLRLEEDGVWNEHLDLSFEPAGGIALRAHAEALVAVNGRNVQHAVLRSGDTIELGPVKLLFWLSETRQASQRVREWLTWIALVAILAAQLALIYWLP